MISPSIDPSIDSSSSERLLRDVCNVDGFGVVMHPAGAVFQSRPMYIGSRLARFDVKRWDICKEFSRFSFNREV